MPYALCPFCFSTLHVTPEQLAVKSGVIRCGHCHKVFNARENELSADIERTIPIKPNEDITQSSTATQEHSSEADSPPIIAAWESTKTTHHYKLPYGLLSFVLVLALLTQIAFIESTRLTQNTQLQPFFKKLNNTFDLSIPSYQNLDEIHIIARQLTPHPKLDELLSFQLTIKNSALAEQPYPSIKLLLTSTLGEPIAQGVFTKNDYLADSEINDYFAPQSLRNITLTFQKPSKTAFGFEISFQP